MRKVKQAVVLLKQFNQIYLFFSKYANSSSKALDINKAVANFIVSDMRPLSIVDNLEFKVLLQKLDPLYVADKIIPEIYNDKKEDIKQKLAKLHQ